MSPKLSQIIYTVFFLETNNLLFCYYGYYYYHHHYCHHYGYYFSFIFYIIVRYYIEIQTRDEVEGSIQQCSLSLRRIIFISV